MSNLAAELDELEARAWPAMTTSECDGWILRWSHGVSQRANSVWPRSAGRRWNTPERVARAEAFYAEHGGPARFQVSEGASPPDLGAALAAHGYDPSPPVLMQTAEVAAAAKAAGPPRPAVILRTVANDEWLSVWAGSHDRSMVDAEVARAILDRVTLTSMFATLAIAGRPAAIGRAVLDGHWVGLLDVGTQPGARRQGASRAIVATLLDWARWQGATRAHLAVEEANEHALALYKSLGFTTASTYRYWIPRKDAAAATPTSTA